MEHERNQAINKHCKLGDHQIWSRRHDELASQQPEPRGTLQTWSSFFVDTTYVSGLCFIISFSFCSTRRHTLHGWVISNHPSTWWSKRHGIFLKVTNHINQIQVFKRSYQGSCPFLACGTVIGLSKPGIVKFWLYRYIV
jgi:hypothetical protein